MLDFRVVLSLLAIVALAGCALSGTQNEVVEPRLMSFPLTPEPALIEAAEDGNPFAQYRLAKGYLSLLSLNLLEEANKSNALNSAYD